MVISKWFAISGFANAEHTGRTPIRSYLMRRYPFNIVSEKMPFKGLLVFGNDKFSPNRKIGQSTSNGTCAPIASARKDSSREKTQRAVLNSSAYLFSPHLHLRVTTVGVENTKRDEVKRLNARLQGSLRMSRLSCIHRTSALPLSSSMIFANDRGTTSKHLYLLEIAA